MDAQDEAKVEAQVEAARGEDIVYLMMNPSQTITYVHGPDATTVLLDLDLQALTVHQMPTLARDRDKDLTQDLLQGHLAQEIPNHTQEKLSSRQHHVLKVCRQSHRCHSILPSHSKEDTMLNSLLHHPHFHPHRI